VSGPSELLYLTPVHLHIVTMPFSTYVAYPNKPGSRFDVEYYTTKHFAVVDKLWRPLGLQSWNVTSFDGDVTAPYLILTQFIWKDADAAAKAYTPGPALDELFANIMIYTDLAPNQFKGEQIASSLY